MKLSLKPFDIPFMVGDTVWVNQFYGDGSLHPYFQATIIQIILDGSLANSVVIRERHEVHELVISSGIYDLKPCGDQAGLPRISVAIEFFEPQNTLYASERELLDYQNQINQSLPLAS